jgi:hypothetical protein
MEGSEWGRLPPELWNKVIGYLIANDGFYANPDLCIHLHEIPDASPVLNDHLYKLSRKDWSFKHVFSSCWKDATVLGVMVYAACKYNDIHYDSYTNEDFIIVRTHHRRSISLKESNYDWSSDLPHGIRFQEIGKYQCMRVWFPGWCEKLGGMHIQHRDLRRYVHERRAIGLRFGTLLITIIDLHALFGDGKERKEYKSFPRHGTVESSTFFDDIRRDYGRDWAFRFCSLLSIGC